MVRRAGPSAGRRPVLRASAALEAFLEERAALRRASAASAAFLEAQEVLRRASVASVAFREEQEVLRRASVASAAFLEEQAVLRRASAASAASLEARAVLRRASGASGASLEEQAALHRASVAWAACRVAQVVLHRGAWAAWAAWAVGRAAWVVSRRSSFIPQRRSGATVSWTHDEHITIRQAFVRRREVEDSVRASKQRRFLVGSTERWCMVGMDNSSPPVLFVVGTAGAGKSSLVTSFQRWSRFLETEVIAVNLDPGAERVHYDAEFDVRDLISLTEVMDEYDLGPNGAQILAADLLAAQAGDVAEQLHTLSGEMMVVDTPGQVELFAFREASSHLIETLGREQSAIIYLFDPMLSRSPSGFVSQMLLSSIVEFRLGLPTKNFLSKADLLEPEELDQILEWSERLEILELALYDEAGGQRTEFAINQLRMMQEFSQAPGLTPLSSELEEGLADILTFAQALFGGMSDARDGFAADIEHEKN